MRACGQYCLCRTYAEPPVRDGACHVVLDDFLMGLAHLIRLAYRLLIWFVPSLLLELSWVAQCLFNALFE